MPSEMTIKRIAVAICAVRIGKEPSLKITWKDCVEEAAAAYAAVYEGGPRYDATQDFSHMEPI